MSNKFIQFIHKPRAKAQHLLRAKRANGGGIHSPYLFRFVTTVLNSKCPFYAFEALEAVHPEKVKHYAIRFRKKEPHPVQRMIFRIIQDHQPATMLEIGNRTGIDTQYMVNASPKALCKSITYAPDTKDVQTLKVTLSQMEKLDFVLFNAPAERTQRMNEFRMCLQNVHEGTLMVVKYIHQTPEQAFTWKLMRNHPEVRASIDLYSFGILFFRNDLPKCSLRIKLN
jgi:hypothetical protein